MEGGGRDASLCARPTGESGSSRPVRATILSVRSARRVLPSGRRRPTPAGNRRERHRGVVDPQEEVELSASVARSLSMFSTKSGSRRRAATHGGSPSRCSYTAPPPPSGRTSIAPGRFASAKPCSERSDEASHSKASHSLCSNRRRRGSVAPCLSHVRRRARTAQRWRTRDRRERLRLSTERSCGTFRPLPRPGGDRTRPRLRFGWCQRSRDLSRSTVATRRGPNAPTADLGRALGLRSGSHHDGVE